ncbi:MAG: hypothetical protein EA401_11690 [Planctomycetota bacterium]|nr:MAG: hypothetical protein EA401_11690 [Planctomycetota bacterium]
MPPRRQARILLVVKRTALERMSERDRRQLIRAHVFDEAQLLAAHRQHHSTVDQVRSAIGKHLVHECWVGDCTPEDIAGADCIVSVGGDGTVFGIHAWMHPGQRLLAVNSDPRHSVGHFTRCSVAQVQPTLDAYHKGREQLEHFPRLQVTIHGPDGQVSGQGPYPIINDCLFTNKNPAAMTRYQISEDQEASELHNSSGVWIATAAGATAAIASAGFHHSCHPCQPALLYQVREPFHTRVSRDRVQRSDGNNADDLRLTRGVQMPPHCLRLTAAAPGMRLYLDGAHSTIPVGAGHSAVFAPYAEALTCLLPVVKA